MYWVVEPLPSDICISLSSMNLFSFLKIKWLFQMLFKVPWCTRLNYYIFYYLRIFFKCQKYNNFCSSKAPFWLNIFLIIQRGIRRICKTRTFTLYNLWLLSPKPLFSEVHNLFSDCLIYWFVLLYLIKLLHNFLCSAFHIKGEALKFQPYPPQITVEYWKQRH